MQARLTSTCGSCSFGNNIANTHQAGNKVTACSSFSSPPLLRVLVLAGEFKEKKSTLTKTPADLNGCLAG